MGTGSGHPTRKVNICRDWPVPVPIFSQDHCSLKRLEGDLEPLRFHEDLSLPTQTIITRRFRVGMQLLGFLLMALPIGCNHERYGCQEGLAQRILPPMNLDAHEELGTPRKMVQEVSSERPARFGQPKPGDDIDPKEVKQSSAVSTRCISGEP